ncbi:hypothetical protein KKA17_01935 [bacterium]|nr:hypothetical protein [bacterium]MBU1882741.1 hypothetical protein [bacterium]
MDLMKSVKILADEYGLDTEEYTIELLLELLDKFGSLNNVLKEGLKPEYKFLKKRSKIIAMLGDSLLDEDSHKIDNFISYCHALNHAISTQAITMAYSYEELLNKLKIKETISKWKESEEEINETDWVLNRLGGKNFIKTIILQEPNQLRKNVKLVFDQYARIPVEKRADISLEYNPNVLKGLSFQRT